MRLSFDDGPGELTGELLDLLARHGRAATFFVLGEAAESRPALVRRMAAEGHLVGNHSWDHPVLPELSDEARRAQLVRCSELIAQLCGTPPTLFRPPYGISSPELDELAGELGMECVLWDVDTLDWSAPGTEAILAALRSAGPDELVLMHDGRRAGRQTLDALELALSAAP